MDGNTEACQPNGSKPLQPDTTRAVPTASPRPYCGSRTRLRFPMPSCVSRSTDPLMASWLRCHAPIWSQTRDTRKAHRIKGAWPLDSHTHTQHGVLGKFGLIVWSVVTIKWPLARSSSGWTDSVKKHHSLWSCWLECIVSFYGFFVSAEGPWVCTIFGRIHWAPGRVWASNGAWWSGSWGL